MRSAWRFYFPVFRASASLSSSALLQSESLITLMDLQGRARTFHKSWGLIFPFPSPTPRFRTEALLLPFLCCCVTESWRALSVLIWAFLKMLVFHKVSITHFSNWLSSCMRTFWHSGWKLIHSHCERKKYNLLLIILFTTASPRKDSIILGTRLQSNLFPICNKQIQFPTSLF